MSNTNIRLDTLERKVRALENEPSGVPNTVPVITASSSSDLGNESVLTAGAGISVTTRGATTYNVSNGSTGSNGTAVRGYWVRGVIRPSAAGTLIARVKREAVGTGPNVRAGSYGRARRLT